jgi:hypothetical protein
MKLTKLFFAVVAGTLLATATQVLADATPSQPVTITGNMVCAKCTLHLTKSCQNVVQVTQDGKTVNYFLVQNDLSKDNHDAICGGGSEKVTVTGTVEEKDGQEVLTPTKIDVSKS